MAEAVSLCSCFPTDAQQTPIEEHRKKGQGPCQAWHIQTGHFPHRCAGVIRLMGNPLTVTGEPGGGSGRINKTKAELRNWVQWKRGSKPQKAAHQFWGTENCPFLYSKHFLTTRLPKKSEAKGITLFLNPAVCMQTGSCKGLMTT